VSGKAGRRVRLEVAPTGWQDRAACKGRTDVNWFPEGPGPTRARQAAIDVCRGCEVSLDCLRYAVANGEQHGIWGGLTEDQRMHLRRDRRRYAELNLKEDA
jgi:WhiB family transcriptional regulator, redox-sensing transcriptional regulator